MSKVYTIVSTNRRTGISHANSMTLTEAAKFYGYTLECGESYQHERGNTKINRSPKTIASLIKNLNAAVNNSAANGYANISYSAAQL